MKKKTGCLVYIGDELLPIYAGIFHKPLEGCLLTNQFFRVNSTLSTGLPNRRRGCSTTLSRCLVWGCRVFKTKKTPFWDCFSALNQGKLIVEIHPFSTKNHDCGRKSISGLYQVQGHKQEVAKMFSYIKIMVAHSNLLHHGSSSSEPSDVVISNQEGTVFFLRN